MKKNMKALLIAFSALASVVLMTGCGGDKTPYETNDEENYSVSVKYDANGGTFTTNTSVIVDSYNISAMEKDNDGQVGIALLPPESERRGNDAFTAIKNGHFLAGWYSERIESTDEEGNTVYTYSGRWDFENGLLKVDPGKEYTSSEPVLTLYAAWVPQFEIEYYTRDTGELLASTVFDPTTQSEISIPALSEETGAVDMFNFPTRDGYTFDKVYYDEAGTQQITEAAIAHSGSVDYESGTAVNPVMRLYVDWLEGEWYHIYTAEQFVDNASVNGSYIIHADLDFAEEIWPSSLMHGTYAGTIQGNGHTFKNIAFVQTNNSKNNTGLFGHLAETANLSDLTFDNVTFTIKGGTRVPGANFGLLAGTISDTATVKKVSILNSTMEIDSACYFGQKDYLIGLVCGMGNPDVVNKAEITCVATGANPESIKISVDGNQVTLENVTE